jgi:GNAT superfamily N-acetyltransferase
MGPVKETDGLSLAWAERRGFVEVGRNSLLVLDLTEIEAPAVKHPDGVEIVSWAARPDVVCGMYAVAREAYLDVPGEEDAEVAPFEQWLSMDMQGAGDRPDATFVALVDGEVVAYAKLALSRARPAVAIHDMTGVRRAWRGRGIARALKAAETLGRRRAASSGSRHRTRSATSRSVGSTSATGTLRRRARSRCAARSACRRSTSDAR